MKKYLFSLFLLAYGISTFGFVKDNDRQPWMDQVDQQIGIMLSTFPSYRGAEIAVMKSGQMLYAQSYGVQDTNNTPVNNNTLFRLASVSKTLTAVATLDLVQNRQLSLEDEPFCNPNAPTNCSCSKGSGIVASGLSLPPNASINPQYCHLTIYELLTMSAGFCEPEGSGGNNSPCLNEATTDYMSADNSFAALQSYGLNVNDPNQLPASQEQLAGYFLTLPNSGIVYTPGTSYSYSDFSYLLLSVIDNLITEKDYNESFVQYVQNFLNNAGITDMQIGGSLLSERLNNETEYFDTSDDPLAENIFPPINSPTVFYPYGGYYLPAHEGNGGWVGSATDLVKFINAIGSTTQNGILTTATINNMLARPNFAIWQNTPSYWGMGWIINDDNGNLDWTKDGAVPGTTTYVLRTSDDIVAAVVFNSYPGTQQQLGQFESLEISLLNIAALGARNQ